MGKILGRLFVTHIGAIDSETVITVQDSTELDLTNDLQEAVDEASAGHENFIDGTRGWSCNISLQYDQANVDIDSIIANIIDPTQDTDVNCVIGQTAVSGDIAYQATAKTGNVKITSQVKTLVTMSVSLKGVSKLEQITVPV